MKIPIKAVKEFAEKHDLNMCVVFGQGNRAQHVITWGKTIEECSWAADLGNKMKQGLGWNKHLDSQPARVKKLMEENKNLRANMKRILEWSDGGEGDVENLARIHKLAGGT